MHAARRPNHRDAQQRIGTDEVPADGLGPSPLNSVFYGRSMEYVIVSVRLPLAVACALASGCATGTWYARVPEAERGATLAHAEIKPGITLSDVARAMVNARLPEQEASLTFSCAESRVQIILNAGRELVRLGSTRVYATGFASIWVEDFKKQSLGTHGYSRQGPFLLAVHDRTNELLACEAASMEFNATPEGACGHDVIRLEFGRDKTVSSVGPIEGTTCVR